MEGPQPGGSLCLQPFNSTVIAPSTRSGETARPNTNQKMAASAKIIGARGQVSEETLAERFFPEALGNAAARLVDSLKINSVSEKVRRGRRVVIKRRNGYSEPLAA